MYNHNNDSNHKNRLVQENKFIEKQVNISESDLLELNFLGFSGVISVT